MMIPMDIKFLGADEIAWEDVSEVDVNPKIELAVSPHGLASGKPTVLIRINGGVPVVTTARLFATMGRMITARYPNLFED